MSTHSEIKRITTNTLQKMKAHGEKISMLTAYDFSFAKIVDTAGVDVILVGDSASNVMAGHETTLPITLEQMIYHAQSVIRGVKRSLVVVDMPFGSYQSNSDVALASAIRIMKESGAHALKLEGGAEIVDSIKKIVSAGIPVMGHLGLTLQSYLKLGGYKTQGNTPKSAEQIMSDAKALEEAGVFSIVLECVNEELSKAITLEISVPTIGIGSGTDTDGQVLVINDLIGLTTSKVPSFVKPKLDIKQDIKKAVSLFCQEVRGE